MRETDGVIFQVPECSPDESQTGHDDGFESNIAQAKALEPRFMVHAHIARGRSEHLPAGIPGRHDMIAAQLRVKYLMNYPGGILPGRGSRAEI